MKAPERIFIIAIALMTLSGHCLAKIHRLPIPTCTSNCEVSPAPAPSPSVTLSPRPDAGKWIHAMQASSSEPLTGIEVSAGAGNNVMFTWLGWAVAFVFLLILVSLQLKLRQRQKSLLRGGDRDGFTLSFYYGRNNRRKPSNSR